MNNMIEEERAVLVEIYKEIIFSLKKAISSISKKSGFEKIKGIGECHTYLIHTKELITLLIESVDSNEGLISSNLWKLYWFSYLKVTESNLRKDVVLMDDVKDIFTELLEGYSKKQSNLSMINIPFGMSEDRAVNL